MSPLNAPLFPEVDPDCNEDPTRARCSCRNLNTSRGGGRFCDTGVSSSSSTPDTQHQIYKYISILQRFLKAN